MNHTNSADDSRENERALIQAARIQASAAVADREAALPSVTAFRSAVLQSGLVNAADLETAIEQCEKAVTERDLVGVDVATYLVESGVLTTYQADRILAGHASGWQLGDCIICDRLGSGGMGTVYLAEQVKLGRKVALKVLPTTLAKDTDFLARFRREAQTAARLKHPSILQVHDVDEQDGTHFIVMELVRGANLADRLRQLGPLSIHDSLMVVTQVAEGLQYAVENGLIHRDVKPANLIVDDTQTKILDLGLARPLTKGQTITRDVCMLGTPDYMSPEQFEDPRGADIRSDLYSLGCTWYALLTGRPPFADRNMLSKFAAHRDETPPSISGLVPEVPTQVGAILHRLLAKDPAERFAMPADLIQAIDQLPTFAEPLPDRVPLSLAMTECPSLETLEVFELGQTSAAETAAIQQHLKYCEACRLFAEGANQCDLDSETIVQSLDSTASLFTKPLGPLVVSPSGKPAGVAPQQLGQYEIHEVLAQGGMGAVYRARHTKLDKTVALKILPPERLADAPAVERFEREMRAVGKLDHPNIVAAHDAGESQGTHFLVMGFVDGVDLAALSKRLGKLSMADSCELIRQAAVGLHHAHGRGLVHRDIKPSNLMLSDGEDEASLRILDFGLALLANVPRGQQRDLTVSSQLMGTVEYMAPEQGLDSHTVDSRADIYSLGATLYKLLSGESPFSQTGNESPLKQMMAKATGTAPSLATRRDDLPAELVAHVDRMLARQPEDRFATAWEVAEALAPFAAGADLKPLLDAARTAPDTDTRIGDSDVPTQEHATGDRRSSPAESKLPLAATSGRGARSSRRPAMLMAGFGGLLLLAGILYFIRTPHGTLIVEISDPAIKVAVDNGALEITEANAGEPIRVAAGEHKLHVTRGDLAFDTEQFTLARGKEIRLRVELVAGNVRVVQDNAVIGRGGLKQPPAAAVSGETGAFVLLGGEGVAERRFNTLEDAVRHSTRGDTIEIRGNGPFTSDGVSVAHPLVLRAGEGFAPSITLSQAAAEKNIPLLNASASLVLEGLELRRIGGDSKDPERPYPFLVKVWGGDGLHVVNCRLVFNTLERRSGGLINTNVPACTLQNCVLSTDAGAALGWYCPPGGRGTIENCVNAVGALNVALRDPKLTDAAIRLRRNTSVGNCLAVGFYEGLAIPAELDAPLVRLELSGNVTHCPPTFGNRGILRVQVGLEPTLWAREIEALLPSIAALSEQQNVYAAGTRLLQLSVWQEGIQHLEHLEPARGQDLADWNRLWDQQDTGSLEGAVRFQGGDLIHRVWSAGDELTAEDFRLRPDSAGYRAGPDGKDLGANIDLVGPGAAYERWKKTPEYQEATQVLELAGVGEPDGGSLEPGEPAVERADTVRQELKRRNPDFKGHVAYDIQEGKVIEWTIAGGVLPDLSPLLALAELKRLDYAALEPERDAPVLRELTSLESINNHSAANFRLAFAANKPKGGVDDAWVESVRALPPETQVKVVMQKLKDLNPNFEGLCGSRHERNQVLNITFNHSSAVTDISPLRAFSHLQLLHLGNFHLGTPSWLSDLSPLNGMPLTSLAFAGSQVADLSPLAGMKLTALNCCNTLVSDLSPLEGMKLTTLKCLGTRVSDLTPLRGMPLTVLGCGESLVSDLKPLTGMPLLLLQITGTRVADLAPLKGMPLTHLDCTVTQVTDLSPLRGMPLKRLLISDTPVSDLSPLAGMPLTEIGFDQTSPENLAIVRALSTLETINFKPTAAFWKQRDAAAASERPDGE